MSPRRILVYCDCSFDAATMQIRMVGPFSQSGVEFTQAHNFFEPSGRQLLSRFDAVVVHRAIRNQCRIYSPLIAAAREQQIPVILDIDDLLLQLPRSHPDHAKYQAQMVRTLKVVLDADHIVASTPSLAAQLSKFHSSVEVIYNDLPRHAWKDVCGSRSMRRTGSNGTVVTIGYIGSPSHLPDLLSVENAILAVLERNPGQVRFVSAGVPLPSRLRANPNVEFVKPSKQIRHDYSAFVQFASSLSIDVGIAPLLDNEFNRCKSDIKFQEYSALGIPGLYSDLPPYRDRVRHGENGLLAVNCDQWESSLHSLVASSELRSEIVTNSARDLEQIWQANQASHLWNKLLSRTAGKQLALTSDSAHSIADLLDEMIEYQTKLERQLKKSVRYQAGKFLSRFMKRWAA